MMARHAAAHGIDMHVAWTGPEPGERAEEVRETGVGLHHVRDSRLLVPFHRRLARLLAELQPDCVVGLCALNQGRSVHVARRMGVPSRIAWYRSANPHLWPVNVHTLCMRYDRWLALRSATWLLGNSQQALDGQFPGLAKRDPRCGVIGNGLELEAFARPPDHEERRAAIRAEWGFGQDEFVIGHVGRFHEAKNYPTILACFDRVVQQLPHARLVLVGYGPLEVDIRRDIAGRNLESRVVLPGPRTDVANVLRGFDLFLFPSIYEGSPNSLLEAMAAGVPIVASDIDCIQEVVPHRWHEILVDPKESRCLAGRTLELSADRLKRASLSQDCQKRISESYGIDSVLRRLKDHVAMDLSGHVSSHEVDTQVV